ncbi:uncharacterized protein PHALS_08007 [Plasmopara halstedii]|uniref:Uncharacterized protein n=1 Tax=Plasmopara halstedii TaxID=4781 RepID=A0A0P1B6Y9_PLAHL|nr:uncharacterized protein PHALS_08007 [Plasmopara halstedii]CEG50286.1 hypothetical protein PHALS_08007 [Plasmopara halstedii]|eukprot:XP_024586655.1 hypothetical protein PHALS_08007 [Plasmopara halstedii]
MAGRGRGRANTLPAWMTKQGVTAPPPEPTAESRPTNSSQGPTVHNGQFEDAPEPAARGSVTRNDTGGSSSGKRRSRSRDWGNDRNIDSRDPPPMQDRHRLRSRERGYSRSGNVRSPQDRPRSRSRDNGRDRGINREQDRRWEERNRRSRSRSRERRDYRRDNRRGGDDRYEDRGYGYRRTEGRPVNREEEAMERGYRRTVPNGHDDRTSRRYASDYKP